ncbi:DUF4124 domain-containing protein [Undibacterium sp. SXout7W]|uniref:DUF4124 domain-containing protein n=1 Tax=Undibacterium sp. SXout7W TaxID=3413049 RepID=UPI003BF01F22
MKIVLLIGLLAGQMLYANAAQAEVYTCKDANGKVFVSDRPIPECASRTMSVRKENGSGLRDIPPPPTAEERKRAELEKQRQQQEAIAEEQRKKEERYLSARYRSEADIETMRQKSLDVNREKIKAGNEQIKMIQQLIANINNEQKNRSKNSNSNTSAVDGRIKELNNSLKETAALNATYQAEQTRINSEYDATLKQYRDIMGNRH